ncbi:MAG: fibronectin type III domain-containing protein, partial [Salana multivorans]|nr:fibronectin type III domain-containing protein [Salana multivorans]
DQPTDPTDPEYGTIATPSYLRTAHVEDGSVTMRWEEISGAAGYVLSRGDCADGPFTVVATVGDQVWATDATADTTRVNYYRVQSRPASGLPSVPSRVAVATLAGDGVEDVELPASGVLTFDFGDGELADGAIAVDASTAYSAQTRYGFVDTSKVTATDRGTDDPVRSDFVQVGATDLVIDLPNGDYNVSVVAGDATAASSISMTVETMSKVQTTANVAGSFLEMTFPISLVDGQLTIEVGGTAPKLNQLVITRLEDRTAGAKPTVWVTGDSTVQSYTSGYAPQAGWGQMLDRFLDDSVTVDNRAIGGRSAKNFISQGRLDEVLGSIRPGDYLYVQFGHNDNSRGVDDRWAAPLDYKNYLRTYIDGARQRGATPIIVTPVSRRDFNATTGVFNVSFPAYVAAATAVAQETGTPLVDLSASSRAYLNQIGPELAKSVFLHVPAGVYPGRPSGTTDDTHFQEYGAIQMARLVAGDTAELDVPLADHVLDTELPSDVPAAPAGLVATSITNSSALLTWTAVEGADIYKVYRRPAGGSDADYALVGSSTVAQVTTTGMTQGTAYDVVVVATNGAGDSGYSNVVSFRTKAPLYAFDFQLAGNVVEPGYLEVNENTRYTEALGYGWIAAGPGGRDRGIAFDPVPSALLRDFALPGTGNTFVVDLPPGTYSVTALYGDMIGTARLAVTLEGVTYGSTTGGRGSLSTKAMQPVTVLDGQLTMVADGWLNGLEITPLQYAPADLTLEEVTIYGTDVAVSLSWAAAAEADGYRVYRQTAGATSPALVGTVTGTSFVDRTAAVGQVYSYKVVSIDAIGSESVASNVVEVTTVDPDVPTAATPTG